MLLAAGRRASVSPCRTHASCSTSPTREPRARSPTSRSRPTRSSGSKKQLEAILAHHTGQPIEKIEADTDRDFVLTAQEAKDYGIIDEVIAVETSSTALVRSGPSTRERFEGEVRGKVR